jgi:hypothetical protein
MQMALLGSVVKQWLVKTEDLTTAVVRNLMCELAEALKFFVVTSFSSPLKPITIPEQCLVTKRVII